MPVYGDDRDRVTESERLAIAGLCRQMDRLGCEVTSVRRESGSAERWHVQWRINDLKASVTSYGATGDSALTATRAALMNAQSGLSGSVAF